MYFWMPLPVPFLKQLSARLLHIWKAAAARLIFDTVAALGTTQKDETCNVTLTGNRTFH